VTQGIAWGDLRASMQDNQARPLAPARVVYRNRPPALANAAWGAM